MEAQTLEDFLQAAYVGAPDLAVRETYCDVTSITPPQMLYCNDFNGRMCGTDIVFAYIEGGPLPIQGKYGQYAAVFSSLEASMECYERNL